MTAINAALRKAGIVTVALLGYGHAPADAQSLGDTYKTVNPSVVEIRTVQRAAPEHVGMMPAAQGGLGSGVLISADKVLTASHVVEIADAIQIVFVDGRTRSATIVSSERFADVSLLQLESPIEGIKPARLGDSDRVEVGDQVFIVGAPYGISHTFTVGYVSGVHRDNMTGDLSYADLIQTDAAINSGNSGGPMFNKDGEVVGIVSHILSRSGGFEGLGFAVAINTARELVIDQRSYWPGLTAVILPERLASAINVPQRTGLLIQQVALESPAAQMGLRAGDIPVDIDGSTILLGGDVILAVNDVRVTEIDSIRAIRDLLRNLEPGERMRLEILRDGARTSVESTPVAQQ